MERPPTLFAMAIISISVSNFGVESVDLDSAKEMPCFTPDKSRFSPVNLTWLLTPRTNYYSRMSRFDLYVTAADQAGLKPKDLAEDRLYYEGCILWETENNGNGYLQDGFGIQGKKYSLNPVEPDFSTYTYGSLESGYNAIAHLALTDNKTFFLVLSCYPDWNQMGWSVGSTVPSLPKKTVAQIFDYVEFFGFKREQFTSLRFDECKGVNTRTGYGYLPNTGT